MLAEHIYEPIFMIYAMGIVARSTLETFLSSENYIVGVWKAISMSKYPIFGAFSAKNSCLMPHLLAELIYERTFMIYAIRIVARSTLETFLNSENYIFGVWKAIPINLKNNVIVVVKFIY